MVITLLIRKIFLCVIKENVGNPDKPCHNDTTTFIDMGSKTTPYSVMLNQHFFLYVPCICRKPLFLHIYATKCFLLWDLHYISALFTHTLFFVRVGGAIVDWQIHAHTQQFCWVIIYKHPNLMWCLNICFIRAEDPGASQ